MDTQGRIRRGHFAALVEIGCWFIVGSAPILYWINGAAVSHDQLIARSGLLALAVIGGTVLRLNKPTWSKQ
jgi:hypothetical protein